MIGHIVSLLMDTQRQQQRQLINANVQLSEYALALEHLTETRERNRLARELHDTLAHTLSGLSVNLEAIKISLDKDDGDNIRLIDHALENTRQGLDNTRRALKSLRSKPIEEFGLLIALKKLADYAAERGGFELTTDLPASLPAFSSDEEQTIYRIAQEAFENIIKHAEADRVSIKTTVDKNRFRLLIEDDGIGFTDLALEEEDIYGVRGMSERAKMVSGQLLIDSHPGQGTTIDFRLELNHG
jgi:signal transduction histidine kinase